MDETGAEPSAKPAQTPPEDPLLAPRLSAGQLALLHRYGQVRPTVAGQELFREGDRSYDFIVIVSGAVTILDHQAGVARELATGGPGEFVAELNLFTGERLFTTAVVKEPGSILVVPVDRVQRLFAQDQALADLIMQTSFRRRQWLLAERAGMRIIGSRSSADARRLREFAARNRLAYVWLDVETTPAASLVLRHHAIGPDETPIVVMRGGEVLRNPSNTELARAAGFGSGPVAAGQTFDVAVVGAGPAGLAASVYGASEGLAVVTVDGLGVGGQIGTTSRIENYLGFPVGVSGDEFAERALVQVLRFGATLLVPSTASGLAAQDQVDPEDAVVIVGGRNSAGQAATWLADHRHPVTIVIRGDDLAASMSRYLIDRVVRHPGIEVVARSAVRQLDGAARLERVVIEDLATSTRRTLTCSALFVLIGAEPHTRWLAGSVELDRNGFVATGPDLSRPAGPARARLNRGPYLLETSMPGVFAAGDVRSGSVKRVASAVGEGSIAIRFVSEHLGRRTGFAAAGPSTASRSAAPEST
jgi:thioredoxin reductase (NADPH)